MREDREREDREREKRGAEERRRQPLTLQELGALVGRTMGFAIGALITAIIALILGGLALFRPLPKASDVRPSTVDSLVVAVESLKAEIANRPLPADSASVAQYNQQLGTLIAELEGVHEREEKLQADINRFLFKK